MARAVERIEESELVERSIIWWPEIRWLMQEFEVGLEELADLCEVSLSTIKNYNANSQLPNKHNPKIIHFFLRKFAERAEEQEPEEDSSISSELEYEAEQIPGRRVASDVKGDIEVIEEDIKALRSIVNRSIDHIIELGRKRDELKQKLSESN